MKLLDKVKISNNWMVLLPTSVRKKMNASKGDFLYYIEEEGDIKLKHKSREEEMEAFRK